MHATMSGKSVVTFAQGWGYMNRGITKLKSILEGVETSFTSEEYMLLYTKIYDMCTQKPPYDYSEQLYDGYGEVFENYIRATVLPSLREKHAEFLLKACVQRWTNHNVMAKWLGRFFGYIDRYYVSRRAKAPLNEVAVTCFRDMVYSELNGKLCQAVISLIDKEREGELIDRALVKNALDLFLGVQFGGMDFYNNDFEAHMLQDTAAYYSRKASEWILTDTCPEYMVKAEECLTQEKDRVSNYLHSDSEKKLLETAQKELLSVYCMQLIEKENTGCRALLKDGKFNDLSRMFRLLSRIPQGLEPIATMFKDHVTSEGLSLVKQADEAASNKKPERREAGGGGSQDQEFVRKVIDLHDEYMKYVEGCFQNHSLFHKAIKDAFDVFCNKDVAGCSAAELLATFCDYVIKKGDQSIDETLEKIVTLLVYINDKDLFAEFCKKKLARRLLFDKSSNDQNDIAFLAKLKQQCGGQFTSKMEGMVKDLEVARDNQSQFADQVGSKTGGISFSVKVLTTGFWPSYKSHNLNLPLEMAKCVEVFKEFYHGKVKHRKLSWIHSLGSCNVNAQFDMKQMKLIVTPFQACALDLFNNAERLRFSEIKNQLNLGEEDVVRVLHSLCCGKYKILIKEPNTTTISPSDYFAYNAKFTDKTKRIKIPLPPVDEKKKTLEDVGKDRRYTIDASLVRIMKARKVLGHQQLVMMCVDQVSKMFKPEIKLIKRRIEDLISRDYLERDNDNPNIFKYVA